MSKNLMPTDHISNLILNIRGEKVILDSVLAKLYGVETRRLNEQVKRNKNRFPQEFAFQLTAEEKQEVIANCDNLANIKFSPALPWVFTEHGAIMAANVLNSPKAVDMSVHVVKAFIRIRQMLMTHKELSVKLNELEKHVTGHDQILSEIISAIKQLMLAPEKPKRQIGFKAKKDL